jgi:crotonobetainyl-CoA:carnitine CoA-transferase CaiB-like acyl-CoA transferase
MDLQMPFEDYLVIDLSRERAGSYCTRLLAGFGARVVKVEPLGGDPLRACGPFVGGDPGIERSIPFHWLNGGKESVALDLESDEGRRSLEILIRQADVIVESLGPGVMQGWGFDRDAIRKLNPRLIFAAISNFGDGGPYRDYKADDAILYALSGGMIATGDPDKAPLSAGPAVARYTAGLYAYIAVLMAAWRRFDSQDGEFIEVPVHESALQNVETHLSDYAHNQKIARRNGDDHLFVPWRTYPCRDGYAAVIGGPVRHWHKAAQVFDEPRLAVPDLKHMVDRHKRRREVEDLLRPWLMGHDRREVYHKGQAAGLALSYLASLAEAADWPQHQARGFFVHTEPHPVVGQLRISGAPFRLESAPWCVGRAPLLGEHTRSVLDEMQRRAVDKVDHPARGCGASTARRPLEGLRVIDMSHGWAGPHGGRLLADSGAEVVKLEYFRRLDFMRGARRDNRAYDRHSGFVQFNRNKRSLALDLRDRRDLGVFEDLVRTADVVMSTSRPGVLERLGISLARLRELKPDIIFLAMSAHGLQGPESSYGQYGGGIEAISGIQSLTAYDEKSDPRRIREMDVTNGIVGAAALLTALLARRRTGVGRFIDLSEVEAATHALAGEHFLEHMTNGFSSLPVGNRHATQAPHGCYRCRGEDAWLVISIGSDDEWRALCRVTGHAEWLTDPRFADLARRRRHHDALDELITEWTRNLPKLDAMAQLQKGGVPAGAVLNAADLLVDPHLQERGYFRRPVEAPAAPLFPGFPFQLSEGGGEVRRPGPALGEANQEIVCEWLKRPASDVRRFSDDEVRTEFDVD